MLTLVLPGLNARLAGESVGSALATPSRTPAVLTRRARASSARRSTVPSMEQADLLFVYCADGPYRHVRKSVQQGADWFAWGYRGFQVDADSLSLVRRGAVADVWEIDDTREPRIATFLMAARLDFVAQTGDYVPMTFWRVGEVEPSSTADQALRAARRGLYVLATRGAETRDGIEPSELATPDGEAIQAP